LRKAKNWKIIAQKCPNCIIKAELKFDRIFLKFEKLPSNYITKLSTYVRHKYEIFENFGAMLMPTPNAYSVGMYHMCRMQGTCVPILKVSTTVH